MIGHVFRLEVLAKVGSSLKKVEVLLQHEFDYVGVPGFSGEGIGHTRTIHLIWGFVKMNDTFEQYIGTLGQEALKALLLKYVEWDKVFDDIVAGKVKTIQWKKPERL